MKRWMMLVLTCLGVTFVWAQSPFLQPAPGLTDGILGPQLIAWSELQKPQPVPQQPQPVPAPDTQNGKKPSEPNQRPDAQSQPDAQQQPQQESQESTAAKSVTGTVIKVSGKYVLQTADNVAYQLDNDEKAKQYEGKRVKVTGSLDRGTGILHVTDIEFLS